MIRELKKEKQTFFGCWLPTNSKKRKLKIGILEFIIILFFLLVLFPFILFSFRRFPSFHQLTFSFRCWKLTLMDMDMDREETETTDDNPRQIAEKSQNKKQKTQKKQKKKKKRFF